MGAAAWIAAASSSVISSAIGSGAFTMKGCWHFGQRTRLPSRLSGTATKLLQSGQFIWMDMVIDGLEVSS